MLNTEISGILLSMKYQAHTGVESIANDDHGEYTAVLHSLT